MSRPTNKKQLLDLSTANYENLLAKINGLSPQEQTGTFGFEDRDKNIRDILVHLYEWHQMLKRWYKDGMAGQKPAIPAEGYTWQTLPALNLVIWKKYQTVDLTKAKKDLAKSHQEVMNLIKSHTDKELFTKKKYKWTGTTSLGAYFISSTSSHYDWALKKLKRYLKELGK